MSAQRPAARPGPTSIPLREDPSPERHDCRLETTCQPPAAWGEDDLAWPATVCTLSRAGVCLVLHRRFERGTALGLQLPSPHGGASATSLVRVAQVRPNPNGGWLLACTFVSALSDEEVQHALAVSRQGPAPTRRLPTVLGGVLFRVAVRPGLVHQWLVKRLDLSGPWPPPRGKVLALRLPGADDPARIEVGCCYRQGEHWVVAGAFTTPPTDTILRALGYPA
jgi:hypothetical protein